MTRQTELADVVKAPPAEANCWFMSKPQGAFLNSLKNKFRDANDFLPEEIMSKNGRMGKVAGVITAVSICMVLADTRIFAGDLSLSRANRTGVMDRE